jgi:LCP family protein required for cell wall assembly
LNRPTTFSQRRRRATLVRRQPRRRTSGCLPAVFISFASVLVVVAVAWLVWRVALAGRRPVNVLVLGLDRRPQEAGPSRSDVTMLVRLDPRRDAISLLSIPRDLYVWIPEYGAERINAAHFWGEWQAAGGGPALVAQTIRQNFGVPVDGYVRLDFGGFVQLVDALGGIYVEVPSEIRDDFFPTEDFGYTSIVIPAGRQKMDGETALIYVRTRHASSDFDRARRQQQVAAALLRRAASPAGWLRLPAAMKAVRASVDTDLGPGDVLFWAAFAARSDLDALDRIVLDETMAFPWTTEDGSQVLMPDWELILPLMRRFMEPPAGF